MNEATAGGFFQVGYVCRDLPMAMRQMCGADASTFLIVDVGDGLGAADAPVRRMALAHLGSLNIELIEVSDNCPPFFSDALKNDGSPGFHHYGYLATDPATWESLQASLGAGQGPVMAGEVPGTLRYAYFDRRADLGHYVELILLEEGGKALFDNVPFNRLAPTVSGEQA